MMPWNHSELETNGDLRFVKNLLEERIKGAVSFSEHLIYRRHFACFI